MKKPAYYRKLDKLEADKLKEVKKQEILMQAYITLAKWKVIGRG